MGIYLPAVHQRLPWRSPTYRAISILNAPHEILTNEIAGKASPASALNQVMHVSIKSICNKTLIAPFRVQHMF